MAAKVVWFEVDADQHPCLLYHYPGRLIANRKNPIIWAFAVFDSVISKPVSYFLWNENNLVLLPAFGLPEDQFAILNVIHCEFQHLADPHSTAGH